MSAPKPCPSRVEADPATLSSRQVADIVPFLARSLLGLAEDRGLGAERLCRGLGFTYGDLLDRDLRLSYQQVRALILRVQQVLQEPALGIASGGRQTPVSWGLPGLAMLTCETFGEAIGYGLAQQGAAGAMLHNVFEVSGRQAHLDVQPHHFDLEIEPFLVEENFAGAVAVARYLVGAAFSPLRVEFAFDKPAHEARYRRFFRCPIHYGAGGHRLTLESRWLEVRLPGYDRITCGLMRAQLNTVLPRPAGRSDLVESLTNRMRLGGEELPRQAELAQMINLSERTLRRRLESQSQSFRSLRDATRYEKARDLLQNSGLTMAEVAGRVGYSDARAFRRAFKRWSGVLPADFRARAVAAAPRRGVPT
ncbi:MAG: AraC family transcriptional regulator [Curvibacter sp.]|nr:MAG: AraC family transcriptional regulator [Curvibacter sp.]